VVQPPEREDVRGAACLKKRALLNKLITQKTPGMTRRALRILDFSFIFMKLKKKKITPQQA
jgi:hypothetical protein